MNAYDRDRCNRPCTNVAKNCRYVLSGLLLGSFQPSLQSFFLGCGSSAVKIHQKIEVMLIFRSEEKNIEVTPFKKSSIHCDSEVEYWAIPDRKVKGCLELPQIAFKVSRSIQSLDNKHAGSDCENRFGTVGAGGTESNPPLAFFEKKRPSVDGPATTTNDFPGLNEFLLAQLLIFCWCVHSSNLWVPSIEPTNVFLGFLF